MVSAGNTRLSDQVVEHFRRLIEDGRLRAGERLPTERELATLLGVSRQSVRAGLQALGALGLIEARRGAGTFLTNGPPVLESEGLRLQAVLHGVARAEMFEARRLLEVGVARLAAERASPEQVVAICHEVMEMFASASEPQRFLVHDVRFHRAVARASGNPVLAALVDMVSALFYEKRKATVEHHPNLGVTADFHRRIYEAVRDHNADRAAEEMDKHLAEGLQLQELMDRHLAEGPSELQDEQPPAPPAGSDGRRLPGRHQPRKQA
ncbi:MAG TPA: FadR/GntR family transcriptional regulator [Thermoanaerobaculaceae bacterium]|nr:FadR/GntR family transcriptional regulator [Thermoanaerobaculaceae bacterium]